MNIVSLFDIKATAITSFDIPIPTGVWLTGSSILWNQGFKGKGCLVGVIDSGVDRSHPDFGGRVIGRRDYVKDGRTEGQFHPHGTHVAGTIGANGKIKGVAPECNLMDYRVLDSKGYGNVGSLVGAVNDAVKDGCNVINMSLGMGADVKEIRNAIGNAISNGVTVIAAAGNSGPNTMSYPASYKGVVSVGAVDYNVGRNKIELPRTPWFSSSNPYVTLACDGWQIYSTIPGKKYGIMSGTSMASPHASGMAALLWQKLGKVKQPVLYSNLVSSTVDILTPGRDNISGVGLLTFHNKIPAYQIPT